MIDATKSPTPAWQRYAVAGLLTLLILVAGYMIYSKEIKHPSAVSSPPAATSPSGGTTHMSDSKVSRQAPPSTIPGGVPTSSRDPFAP